MCARLLAVLCAASLLATFTTVCSCASRFFHFHFFKNFLLFAQVQAIQPLAWQWFAGTSTTNTAAISQPATPNGIDVGQELLLFFFCLLVFCLFYFRVCVCVCPDVWLYSSNNEHDKHCVCTRSLCVVLG